MGFFNGKVVFNGKITKRYEGVSDYSITPVCLTTDSDY